MSPQVVGTTTAVAGAALMIGLGWLAPGRPSPPTSIMRLGQPPLSQPLQPPLEGEALDLLSGLLVDPPATKASVGDPVRPAPQPSAPRAPPPPPPPDVALTFRREVSAIVNRGVDGLAVLVVDASVDGRRSRLLKVGDDFADGWRIAALSSDEAVLAKGDVRKHAPFYTTGGAN